MLCRLLSVFCLFFSFSALHAQNLVNNSGFEITNSCPEEKGKVGEAVGWFIPNFGTSDLYHECGSDLWSPGNNEYGYQEPAVGNAFVGIRVYATWGDDNREYISNMLIQSLDSGKNYEVSFKVSLADGNEVGYATDDLGLYLSADNPTNANFFSLTPQIENQENNFIDNTDDWVEISGCYQAIGGEQYLTIGNFKNDQNTTVTEVPKFNWSDQAYYYIDDVVIKEITESMIDLGPDTTLCADESALLKIDLSNATFLWNTGETTPEIEIKEGGIYSVKASQDNCIFYDTINLKLQTPPILNLGPDTTSCQGNKITFSSSISSANFLWSTGDTTISITADTNQTIILNVTQDQCSVADTVNVSFLRIPSVDLGMDSILCLGHEVIWELNGTDVSTIWQDESTETFYKATSNGLYYVIQSNECGSAADTVSLTFFNIQDLSIPNIITPNGDGKNEKIIIEHMESCTWVFTVYNRWGGLIYSKTDYKNTWPESTILDGLYFYELTNLENDHQLKGWIQVVR